MLINSVDLLADAKAKGYAVVAANYFDMLSARTLTAAAEEINSPLILAFAQVHHDTGVLSLEEAALIGKFYAERSSAPVVLHLDHGTDEAFIERAMALGFSSVMLDASMDPYEENVRRTKAVVTMAHALGLSVEAEIGHVGTGENYNSTADSDSVYTTVSDARSFAGQTGVDSLAVSIGTAHGVYKNNARPEIQFDLLHEIAAAVSIPLVLHGGSGTGDENLSRCAHEGISKINVFTDFMRGAMKQVKAESPAEYFALRSAAAAGMRQTLLHYIRLFS